MVEDKWEIALLSRAKIPNTKPTVFLVIQHVRSLIYEQTVNHMPIPLQAISREVADICTTCNRVGHSWQQCKTEPGSEALPDWDGFHFDPHWATIGLSQIDQERLAIGRWASYIQYNDPEAKDLLPRGTRLTKAIFDEMLAKYILCLEQVRSTLVQLYQQGVISLDEIAVVAGNRGVHIVPPTWCKPVDNGKYKPTEHTINSLHSEKDMKR